MNTVIIEGPEQATHAGTWATQHIKHKWSLDLLSPFAKNPSYAFRFSDERDATHFALKWR
jgi:hypothetical protein